MAAGEKMQAPMSENGTPHAQFDLIFVDELPGDRKVLAVERKGRFAWLVLKGAMDEQAADELMETLKFVVGAGLWRQNWNPQSLGLQDPLP